MMRFGIPTFRLPRDILDAEIDRLLALDITVKLNTRVTDLDRRCGPAASTRRSWPSARSSATAPTSRPGRPPGSSTRCRCSAPPPAGERPQLGRTVVVYGGGNTAMDVARTARRLGADEAIVVYRRSQAQMPANPIELQEAVEEGVQVRWLRTITAVGDGTMTLEKMALDEHGNPQPTGEYEQLAGDAVILALGQDVDRSMLETVPDIKIADGVVQVDAAMMTGRPGVFAGGDLVPSARSVTAGIGHGRTAAGHIDRWLRRTPAAPASRARKRRSEPVAFGAMNTWYYSDAPHAVRPRLDAARRTADFSEVVGGLDVDTALYEARRCMSCGNCFGCDNCLRRVPRQRRASSTARTATPSTTTTARAAGCAPPNAHAAPSSWSPNERERAGAEQVSGPVPRVPFGPHRTAPARAA